MLQKNGQPQPNVEKITTEEENQLQEKTKRSADDIRKVFMETYGFEEGDSKLEKLVERELAHSKVVSKLIGQKIHWRSKAEDPKSPDQEVKLNDLGKDEDKDGIRSIERQKAVEKVLIKVTEKFKDLNTEEVFKKIKEVYNEKNTDTLRGDFEKTLWQSFWMAYPDKYREDIKRKASEEDNEYSDKGGSPKIATSHKKGERKFFVKQTSPKDWFLKK